MAGGVTQVSIFKQSEIRLEVEDGRAVEDSADPINGPVDLIFARSVSEFYLRALPLDDQRSLEDSML